MNTAAGVRLFARECRYRGLAPKTVATYLWALDKLSNTFEELPDDPDTLMAWIADQDLASVSRQNLWRYLRTFYRWLARRELATNVMDQLPKPRSRKRFPRTLEMPEVRKLIATTDDRRTGRCLSQPRSMPGQSVSLIIICPCS